jgi:MFS superfamily sulfate permease-like transporter
MIGLGAANLAAGLFQGFPISSSSSRTPVAEAAGAKTQLTGIVGAIAVALLLMFAPNLLKDLPSSALAAVVIAAAIGLFEFADLRRIFRIQQWEFWLSIVCFLGVAVFGVIPGIGIAIGIAVIEFPVGRLAATLRSARPSRWHSGLPRHQALSCCASRSRPGAVSLGRTPLLRQRRALPPARA